MSNYNHIPLTDDSRFSGGVDIGDAQKIKGYLASHIQKDYQLIALQ